MISLRELENEARAHLAPEVHDFFAGGADDEITLRANESAFTRIGLVPRVLQGSAERDLSTSLLGRTISLPVVIAPTAFHRLAHPDGEIATARAAQAAGTIMIVSMAATTPVEDIPGDMWFQFSVQPDRELTEHQVRRAEKAGCRALVLTVDVAAFGHRERDLRNGFDHLPDGLICENMRDASGAVRRIEFVPGLAWSDLAWIREISALPLVLKGITHPADARRALDRGVDGLIVSNHGGRQLDSVAATIDLVPAITSAVGGRVPVLLDGGVRRGTDIVKARALGATAVGIGRPALWGLAIDGQRGVERVLSLLREELDRALALCSMTSLDDLSEDLLRW